MPFSMQARRGRGVDAKPYLARLLATFQSRALLWRPPHPVWPLRSTRIDRPLVKAPRSRGVSFLHAVFNASASGARSRCQTIPGSPPGDLPVPSSALETAPSRVASVRREHVMTHAIVEMMRQARGKGASLTPMSTRCCRWSDLDGQRHAINQRWRSPFEPCGWRRTSEVRRASAGDLRSGGVGRCGQPGLGAMAAIRNGHGPRWRARRRRRLRRLSVLRSRVGVVKKTS